MQSDAHLEGVRTGLASLGSAFALIFRTLVEHLRFDRYLLLLVLPFAVVVIPLIPNNTANPQLLAAFANDEPWLTMALEGMTVPPYGNPANFLYAPEGRSPALPAHWGHLRYDGNSTTAAPTWDLDSWPSRRSRHLGLRRFRRRR